VSDLVECYKCGWKGQEDELVEKPGNLLFYDYVAANTMGLDVTRADHQCPKCGTTLLSHRLGGGMVMDQ